MDLNETNQLVPSSNYLHVIPSNKWRAKLYSLNGDGCWDDSGTG